jgi:hypothetical protein
MSARGIQVSRLTRYLYEARMGFLLACLAAVVAFSAFGLRAHVELGCAADAIATASARCGNAAVAQNEAVRPEIRLVFQTTP